MKKIKVLGIAPFESMSTLMLQAGAKRNDISLTVYTGDLEDGAAIASRYTQNDFDFIISRGGTAQLIRQVSSIPVIEITISLRSAPVHPAGAERVEPLCPYRFPEHH